MPDGDALPDFGGWLSFVPDPRIFEDIRHRVDRPGLTVVTGEPASGKSTLARRLATESNGLQLAGRSLESLRDVLPLVDTAPFRPHRPRLIIIDGEDEMTTSGRANSVALRDLMAIKAIQQAHLVITSRRRIETSWWPEDDARSGETVRHYYLSLRRGALEAAIQWLTTERNRLADTQGQGASFHGSVLRSGLLPITALLPADLGSPRVLITPDEIGRFRVVPAEAMPDTQLNLGDSASVNVTPWLTTGRRGIWIPAAAALEELLNEPTATEQMFQDFFEAHPELLAGADYDRVQPHPVLLRKDQGALIPDFMLEPLNKGLADVLDLKLPTVKLTAGKGDRRRTSADVTSAIAQMREYAAYFDVPEHQDQLESRYDLRAYKPRMVLIMGRDDPTIDPLERRRIWHDLPSNLKLETYDELLRRIRRIGNL